jgi:hypothetical protein
MAVDRFGNPAPLALAFSAHHAVARCEECGAQRAFSRRQGGLGQRASGLRPEVLAAHLLGLDIVLAHLTPTQRRS